MFFFWAMVTFVSPHGGTAGAGLEGMRVPSATASFHGNSTPRAGVWGPHFQKGPGAKQRE